MIKISKKLENKLSNYNFIDLFAGIGGFRLALESFGGKCVFTSEWDKHCQNIYEINYGERPLGDITKIKEKTIPNHDILCAGFPCQAFSISGKQRGFEDTRGTLFFDIARIVKYHKPKLLILENVKNFEKHDSGKTLDKVIKTLSSLGYLIKYKVLNASRFGVPQSRKRIFIICVSKRFRHNFKKFEIPESNKEYSNLNNLLISDDEVDKKCFSREFDVKHLIEKENSIKPNLFGLYNQKPIRIGTINKGGQGERIYSTKGHSITLSAYGGGVFSKTGGYLINNKVRKLDPRECARVTGFPDSYILDDNIHQNWKQFGNSVVVNVVQEIIKRLIQFDVI